MKLKANGKLIAFIFLAVATIAKAQNFPAIIVQPASQATAPGGTISFMVSASGNGTLSYQWAKNTTNLTNGTFSGRAIVSGATTNILTLAGITTNDQANYTCRIANSFGSITSSVASLTVYISPTITTQPSGHTNAVGTNVTFTVVASGSTPLNYQWQINGQNIPSATLNVFNINNLSTNDTGSYSVIVSNPAGLLHSSNAPLLVLNPPVITVQPTNAMVLLSNSYIFTVEAIGDSLISYQWQKNGSPIGGATNTSLTVTNAPYSLNGTHYSVIVTNLVGKVTSSSAQLSVVGLPIITTQPTSQTTGVGSNIVFFITATAGASPQFYQWFNASNAITNKTNALLTLTNLQLTDSSGYFVVITNSFGSVTSSIATLNVGYPPVIVQQPHSVTIPLGSTVILSSTVTSEVPISFQWLKEGVALAGETNAILTLTNIEQAFAGLQLIATNIFGIAISSNALVNLTAYPSNYFSNLSQGLIAYYPFNGNANDAAGVNNGIVQGATLITNRFGNPNSAYSFNGTNSYIDIGTSINVGNIKSPFTVSVWFKTSSGDVIITDYDSTSTDDTYAVSIRGSDQITAESRSLPKADYSVATLQHGLGDNNWHQVLYIMDGITNFLVYVDGHLDHMTPYNATLNYCDQPHWRIGATKYQASIGGFFNGSIDDIRIYNRALTPDEVSQLYILESESMPPQNLSASLTRNQAIQLIFTGTPNFLYILQATTNLTPPVNWQSIVTNTTDAYGVWSFIDTNSVIYPVRYYRSMISQGSD